MSDDWFDRFVEVVREDGRDLKAIARAAGVGENYVQQVLKEGKRPGTDRLLKVLNVLDSPATLYVVTGIRMTQEGEKMLQVALSLHPDDLALTQAFAERLGSAQKQAAPGAAVQAAAPIGHKD